MFKITLFIGIILNIILYKLAVRDAKNIENQKLFSTN